MEIAKQLQEHNKKIINNNRNNDRMSIVCVWVQCLVQVFNRWPCACLGGTISIGSFSEESAQCL